MKTKKNITIAFAWPGLPEYAARCIKELSKSLNTSLAVIATRPSIPLRNIEAALGKAPIWIEENEKISWATLRLNTPDLFFIGGYNTPAFERLAREARAAGSKIILMADNNKPPPHAYYFLHALHHRLFRRSRYDGIFVPGKSGRKLARSWGYTDDLITEGLYGADPVIFKGGLPLNKRKKEIIFVGQFIKRKNILGVVEAFTKLADQHPDWSLTLCGNGPLEQSIAVHPNITTLGFVQPSELANILRDKRCLVLPSLEEHWGLVVHEAVSSGCALILSDAIGSADDLAHQDNALICKAGHTASLYEAMKALTSWDSTQWQQAEQTSYRLASQFGPHAFQAAVESIIEKVVVSSS